MRLATAGLAARVSNPPKMINPAMANNVQRSTVHHQRPSRLVSVRAKTVTAQSSAQAVGHSPLRAEREFGRARGNARHAVRNSRTDRKKRRPATAARPPPDADRGAPGPALE